MKRLIGAALAIITWNANAAWLVKSSGEEVISVKQIDRVVSEEKTVLREIVEDIVEGEGSGQKIYSEVLYRDDSLPKDLEMFATNLSENWPNAEVVTLIDQGPSANRIDLTILGDGYTMAERDKFFEDARRLTDDLFSVSTFHSYLPLFNVHAVFVPSNESGITDGRRVDTAFGLSRSPAGSKRAIFPGNTRAIDAALRLAPDTDYPILVANDDFYGGLGGRYAITTRSVTSGSKVLRHELGHNFGDVGEEYDGGSVYSGANSSRSSSVTWAHWLTNGRQVFESKMLSGDYVWQNLNDRPYRTNINFPEGSYYLNSIISSVGWSHESDVSIKIDGNPIDYTGHYTPDRSFFYFQDMHMAPGRHSVEITNADGDRDDVLAFMNIYAHPTDIIIDKNHVAAYSNFNSGGRHVGYRPTFDTCLMREMNSVEFCAVDKENMWNKFFQRIDLIDEVLISQTDDGQTLEVKALHLDGLDYQWYQLDSKGQKTRLPESGPTLHLDGKERGRFEVQVRFNTEEVRSPAEGFFDSKTISL